MYILLFILLNLIGIVLSTLTLVGSLFLVGGEPMSKDMILKSLALVVAVALVAYIPFFGVLAGVIIWFAGVMAIFEKDFIQTLIIAAVCTAIGILLNNGIAMLLLALYPDAAA